MMISNHTTINRLRLNAMLRDFGLDQPLDEHDLALQLLGTELRLKKAEDALVAIEDKLQARDIHLLDDHEGTC